MALPERKYYSLDKAVEKINRDCGSNIDINDLIHFAALGRLEICTYLSGEFDVNENEDVYYHAYDYDYSDIEARKEVRELKKNSLLERILSLDCERPQMTEKEIDKLSGPTNEFGVHSEIDYDLLVRAGDIISEEDGATHVFCNNDYFSIGEYYDFVANEPRSCSYRGLFAVTRALFKDFEFDFLNGRIQSSSEFTFGIPRHIKLEPNYYKPDCIVLPSPIEINILNLFITDIELELFKNGGEKLPERKKEDVQSSKETKHRNSAPLLRAVLTLFNEHYPDQSAERRANILTALAQKQGDNVEFNTKTVEGWLKQK